MKIRTQLITSLAIFGVLLGIIAASVVATNERVARLDGQEEIAISVGREASELAYLSNDFLLYRESQQRARWDSKLSSFSRNLSNLNPDSPAQQAIVSNIKGNLQRLRAVFSDVAATLETTPQAGDTAAVQALVQVAWSRMAVQNQAMFFDALRLSEMLRARKDQLKQTNVALISGLLVLFGAYLVINYLLVYRRVLRSISHLQAGTNIIGSGNLDFAVPVDRDDEIGALSRAFNAMASSLKGVTASKAELEREIAERTKIEEALIESEENYRRIAEEIQSQNEELQTQHEETLALSIELQKSELKYRTLFNSMKDGFTLCQVIYDASGKPHDFLVLDANPASEVANGIRREDFVGKTWRELWPGAEEYWRDVCDRAVLNGEDVRHANYAAAHDRWYEVHHFSPGKDLLATVFVDTTSRKKAEDERERLLAELRAANTQLTEAIAQEQAARLEAEAARRQLSNILESIADAVFVFDVSGNITMGNTAAHALVGRERGEPLGTIGDLSDTLELRFPDGRLLAAGDLAINRALRQGDVAYGVERLATHPKTHQSIWLQASVAPLRDRDGQITGAVAATADITRLRELQERQREFVSLISHDLRGPLTSVLGTSQMLQRGLEKRDLQQEGRVAQALVKSARRMEGMIRDLADSAGLEAGVVQMYKEPADLLHFLFDLVERTGRPEERVRISIEATEQVSPVLVDVQRLERAVTNILTNALKYSPPGTPVAVRVEQRDGRAVVAVSDQGIGIPPEDLPHIFERHYRAKSADKQEGLGLGLYITRLIVEAHGGQVCAESEVGKGTTFYVSLPT